MKLSYQFVFRYQQEVLWVRKFSVSWRVLCLESLSSASEKEEPERHGCTRDRGNPAIERTWEGGRRWTCADGLKLCWRDGMLHSCQANDRDAWSILGQEERAASICASTFPRWYWCSIRRAAALLAPALFMLPYQELAAGLVIQIRGQQHLIPVVKRGARS